MARIHCGNHCDPPTHYNTTSDTQPTCFIWVHCHSSLLVLCLGGSGSSNHYVTLVPWQTGLYWLPIPPIPYLVPLVPPARVSSNRTAACSVSCSVWLKFENINRANISVSGFQNYFILYYDSHLWFVFPCTTSHKELLRIATLALLENEFEKDEYFGNCIAENISETSRNINL